MHIRSTSVQSMAILWLAVGVLAGAMRRLRSRSPLHPPLVELPDRGRLAIMVVLRSILDELGSSFAGVILSGGGTPH